MIRTKVIVVEDEADIREGLRAWLCPTHDVISFGCADSFLAAVPEVCPEQAPPTCLLLDFQLPGMNGVDLQRRLRLLNIQHPIVFMSGAAHKADVIDAWRGGAVDFILKPFTTREIDAAIARSFETVSSIQAGHQALQSTGSFTPPEITRREAQVLQLLGEGLQQQEVAERLGLSLRTVKMYRAFLKTKLNLTTLAEIGRYCEVNRRRIDDIVA